MAETDTSHTHTPWFITPAGVRWLDMTKEQRAAHNRERRQIRCPRCPNFWTGLRACHCSACHRTFSGITGFDMHREGDHARGTRHCVDPEKVGLVLVNKPGDWACWSQPGTYDGPYEESE